jgi:hypothetical protein
LEREVWELVVLKQKEPQAIDLKPFAAFIMG